MEEAEPTVRHPFFYFFEGTDTARPFLSFLIPAARPLALGGTKGLASARTHPRLHSRLHALPFLGASNATAHRHRRLRSRPRRSVGPRPPADVPAVLLNDPTHNTKPNTPNHGQSCPGEPPEVLCSPEMLQTRIGPETRRWVEERECEVGGAVTGYC